MNIYDTFEKLNKLNGKQVNEARIYADKTNEMLVREFNAWARKVCEMSEKEVIDKLGLTFSEAHLGEPVFITKNGYLINAITANPDKRTVIHCDILLAAFLNQYSVEYENKHMWELTDRQFNILMDACFGMQDYFIEQLDWIKVNLGTRTENGQIFIILTKNISYQQHKVLKELLYDIYREKPTIQIYNCSPDADPMFYDMKECDPEYIMDRIDTYYRTGRLLEDRAPNGLYDTFKELNGGRIETLKSLDNIYMETLNTGSFYDVSRALNEEDENISDEQANSIIDAAINNKSNEKKLGPLIGELVNKDFITVPGDAAQAAMKAAGGFGKSKAEWPYQLKLLLNAYLSERWLRHTNNYIAALKEITKEGTPYAHYGQVIDAMGNGLSFIGNHYDIAVDRKTDSIYNNYNKTINDARKGKDVDLKTLRDAVEYALEYTRNKADFKINTKNNAAAEVRLEAKVVKNYPKDARDFHNADIVLICSIEKKKLFVRFRLTENNLNNIPEYNNVEKMSAKAKEKAIEELLSLITIDSTKNITYSDPIEVCDCNIEYVNVKPDVVQLYWQNKEPKQTAAEQSI